MDRESPSNIHEAVTDCLCSALYIVEVSTSTCYSFFINIKFLIGEWMHQRCAA